MFCPLCKSEFRQGFTKCSDCQISLLATADEAERVSTECFWAGSNRKECNRILTALAQAGIPQLSKERVKSEPWPWLSFLLVRFMRPRPVYELKIWILQSDLDRARQAVPKVAVTLDD
jgi:hypothetical protein